MPALKPSGSSESYMNSGFSMFILDIEPFFHRAVRGPETVALMGSIGHQQIKVGLRGRPVAHFRIHERRALAGRSVVGRRASASESGSRSRLYVAAMATKGE